METLSTAFSTQIESLAQSLAAADKTANQQETQKRLLQRENNAFDKLEAQAQALQETQGTYATKIILQSGPAACVDWLPSSVELNHAINWLWKQQQGALGAVGGK